MTTAQKVDKNGFRLVKGCPISSFGVFEYGAGQIGLGGDPMRIVKVFRPESAVNDPEAIESFKDLPLINDHEMLSGFQDDKEATAPEEYGISGTLTANVYYDAPWLRGDLKIFSRKMQEDLDKGKKDLSLGYSSDFQLMPGVFEGQPYEVVQTRLRGNHIALVDEGRVAGARVLDGLCFDHLRFDVIPSDNKEHVMKQTAKDSKTMDSAVAQLKALLPALEQFLNEEAAEPSHQDNPNGEVQNETVKPAQEVQQDEGAEETQEQNEGDAEDLPTLIQNVEAVLGQLKSMLPAAQTEEGQTNDEAGANAEKSGSENASAAYDENETAAQGQSATTAEKAELSKATTDAALQRFYADAADKARVYDRLSKVVGAFDCSTMDSRQVAIYGTKKLGIVCDQKFAPEALNAYLNGVEAAQKQTKQIVNARTADSKAATAELDAYLKGN